MPWGPWFMGGRNLNKTEVEASLLERRHQSRWSWAMSWWFYVFDSDWLNLKLSILFQTRNALRNTKKKISSEERTNHN